jgi:dihydroxy-acid dehydratase
MAAPTTTDQEVSGLRAGLTNYGDPDFALFLRKAFIKGAGYSDDALDRRIVGILDTQVGSSPVDKLTPLEWLQSLSCKCPPAPGGG